jgi:hypothetical protein
MPAEAKNPLASGAGGLLSLLLLNLALSAQAIAVRRHDRRMMVVMTMMEVELHLRNNPKQDGLVCQILSVSF